MKRITQKMLESRVTYLNILTCKYPRYFHKDGSYNYGVYLLHVHSNERTYYGLHQMCSDNTGEQIIIENMTAGALLECLGAFIKGIEGVQSGKIIALKPSIAQEMMCRYQAETA